MLFQHHRHRHRQQQSDTASISSGGQESLHSQGTQSSSGYHQDNLSQDSFVVNGNGRDSQRHRRSSQTSHGSQSSQAQYVPTHYGLESPRPHRAMASISPEHSANDSGSRLHYRQDSFSREDMHGLTFQEAIPAGYPDSSSPLSAGQVTPRTKPRSFPRTNPAYVGIPRREGVTSYKRINIETSAPSTPIYNQRFYDVHHMDSGSPQTPQYKHDRSDSDTSHSSYGRFPGEMTDSLMSQHSVNPAAMFSPLASLLQQTHDMSDSHSSQGSLRNLPHDSNSSSQGSLLSVERDTPRYCVFNQ